MDHGDDHGHGGHDHHDMTAMQRLRLAYNVIVKIPKIRGMILYVFFITLTMPNMEVYLTYCNEW
jgi:hypothetical protein